MVSFDHGRLYFHADYVRGRCVKTSVEIDKMKTIAVIDGGDGAPQETSDKPDLGPVETLEQLVPDRALALTSQGPTGHHADLCATGSRPRPTWVIRSCCAPTESSSRVRAGFDHALLREVVAALVERAP